MVPKVLADFLERATVALAATRDAGLAPHIHPVCGWTMEEDGETLTCLLARGFAGGMFDWLEDNRQLALTAEVIGPHETYQFKGEYAGRRPLLDADLELTGRCLDRFVASVRRTYGDVWTEEALRRNAREPELAVRFRVREVFVQTPGPAAGERIFPREAHEAPARSAGVARPVPARPGPAPSGTDRLPDDIRPVLDNGVPCVLATCSAGGVPNASIVSEAYYVDPTHVAISFQFFNKTVRNVRENPRACLSLRDVEHDEYWRLQIEYERSETEGPIFDEMDMRIEAIASASGMSGIFQLKAADIYRVVSVERL